MRGEKEVLDLIIKTGEQDERIRGAYMNGSRTNPNVPKDIFQDYDVVYVVRETLTFITEIPGVLCKGVIVYLEPKCFTEASIDSPS